MLPNTHNTMTTRAILDTTTMTVAATDRSTTTNTKIRDMRGVRLRIKGSPRAQGQINPHTRRGGEALRWALVDHILAGPYSVRKPWSPKMVVTPLEVAYRPVRGGDTQTPRLGGAAHLVDMEGALLQWTLLVSSG